MLCPALQPHGLYSPWNSPGQNTGVGSHSLLQGIFTTQGSNPGLSHCRQILYQLSHKGGPSHWACDSLCCYSHPALLLGDVLGLMKCPYSSQYWVLPFSVMDILMHLPPHSYHGCKSWYLGRAWCRITVNAHEASLTSLCAAQLLRTPA